MGVGVGEVEGEVGVGPLAPGTVGCIPCTIIVTTMITIQLGIITTTDMRMLR